MRWSDGITLLMDMNLSKLWQIVQDRGVWCATVHGISKSGMTQPLNNNDHILIGNPQRRDLMGSSALLVQFPEIRALLYRGTRRNSQEKGRSSKNQICHGCSLLHMVNTLSECVCCVLSHVQLFATPWTVAHQAPLSMEISSQESRSGLPSLSSGIFPIQ